MSDRQAKIKEIERLRKIEEIKRLRSEREMTPAEEAISDPSLGASLKSMVMPAAEAIGEGLEAVDRVTLAPIRAGIGALQEGEGIKDAALAAEEQFYSGINPDGPALLETTPTMTEIAHKGITSSGVEPEYAESMAPFMGTVAEAALDPTMLIPGVPATKAVKAAGRGIQKVGSAIGRGALAAERALATGVARTGEIVTGGALKADKALRMYKELNALEMMMPGTQNWGLRAAQSAKLGQMREALLDAKIEVPGSHEVALNMIDAIQRAQGRTIASPQSQAMLDFIKERAFERSASFPLDPAFQAANPALVPVEHLIPRDLTIDELDDIVRNLDSLTFTPQGNPRMLKAIYGPAIVKSRAMADEILQTVPEGQLFKQTKGRFEALATAGAKRSKLIEAGTNVASLGAAVYTMFDPVAFLTTRALVPGTYVKALAAIHMPRDAARMLAKAQQSGNISLMRDALRAAAQKYPATTERLIRGTVLLAAKSEDDQELRPEEVESIADHRSFDPADIAAEKSRIQRDDSLSSVEKAKRLSEINKNGYVTLPKPDLEPEPQEAAGRPQIRDMESLIKSLEAIGREAEAH